MYPSIHLKYINVTSDIFRYSNNYLTKFPIVSRCCVENSVSDRVYIQSHVCDFPPEFSSFPDLRPHLFGAMLWPACRQIVDQCPQNMYLYIHYITTISAINLDHQPPHLVRKLNDGCVRWGCPSPYWIHIHSTVYVCTPSTWMPDGHACPTEENIHTGWI